MNEERIEPSVEEAAVLSEEEAAETESADGTEKDPAADAKQRIRELEEELQRTRAESALRQARLRCVKHLQMRGIREEAAEFLVPAADADIGEEELVRRVDILAEAVEEAAVRELRARAVGMTPRCGTEAPLSGEIIRQTPVARLAEMMGK